MKKLIVLAALLTGCASRPIPPVNYGVMCFVEPDGKTYGVAEGKFIYDERNNRIEFTQLVVRTLPGNCVTLR